MKRFFILLLSICIYYQSGLSQERENPGVRLLFRGLVMDAATFLPLVNSQIYINSSFSFVSGEDGTFAFYVARKDTVTFKSLGYKQAVMHISDTLNGREFIAGIYLKSDTLSIGEVVIIPRFNTLKTEIFNSGRKTPSTFDNAKYNVAVSAYQGRTSNNKLNDPAANYEHLRQKQKIDAYEKGGIPSDKILGISPFMLIPAAYLLINGLPEKRSPMKPEITSAELDDLNKRYLELIRTVSEDKE